MKTVMFFIFLITAQCTIQAQSVIDKLGKKVERKAKQRADRKTDRAIDKGLDEVENVFNGKRKKSSSDKNEKLENEPAQGSGQTSGFAASSKYDFVPGNKVIAVEDFMQDAVGDFPAKWNTNATGEIMTVNGDDGHWLAFTGKGAFTPDFINDIPENATIEFDLNVSPSYNYYNDALFICIAESRSKNDFTNWMHFGRPTLSGIRLELHPQDAGSQALGKTAISIYEKGKLTMTNKTNAVAAFNRNKHKVHIAMWRQKQRLRIYVGETKLWDLPQAFVPGSHYNKLVFCTRQSKAGEYFFISNIRVAIGDPDTRHKLLTEGRFSTSGIYFNTGSASIRSESHGILKEIAQIMKEHEDLKLQIIGHTDNSGNPNANQTLSEHRAASVKKYLNDSFGINNNRLTTAGKGSSQPIADNRSTEGKAQNRRVEFVKQ
ncbi:OmpA family protein [Pseudobacter ginsenosidimutans]|uniref:OmpA family protein n=1 Tax=Pseudobacter ginsenosidimutans TaxID=661488 RepID=A0A4V2F1V7_9BACT|nr:OmpA family protein [Pseudobacter ginsenosidimutans]QEC43709.1 OmpA family protein [Pseudobacter ginsenosidimutans]RZS75116.1 OmpA family protein [Pseudobacter ginsenosidimutans]